MEPKMRAVGPVVAGLLIVAVVGVAPPASAGPVCIPLPNGSAVCLDPQITIHRFQTFAEPGTPAGEFAWVGLVKVCIDLQSPPSCQEPNHGEVTILSAGTSNPPCDAWKTSITDCEDNDIGGDDEQKVAVDTDGPTILCAFTAELRVDVDGNGESDYEVPAVGVDQPPCP